MLSPSFLGLPENLEGNSLVPFLQSIVISHFIVATMVLLYTMCFFLIDRYYEPTVDYKTKKHKKGTKAVWQRHAVNYNKWADALLPPKVPEDPEMQASLEPAKVAPSSDPCGAGLPPAIDTQRAMLELLLSMPTLFHRQDPTRTDHADPSLVKEILPKYHNLLEVRKSLDGHLMWIIPLAFALVWTIDALIYFA